MAREHTILEDTLRALVGQMQSAQEEHEELSLSAHADISASLKKWEMIPSGPLHKNCCTEICVCAQGHTYVQLADKVMILRPGQFLVIPANTLYRECVKIGENCRNLWLNMCKGDRIRANITICKEASMVSLCCTKMINTTPPVKAMLTETLDRELSGDRFGATIMVKNRLVETVIDMIRTLELEEQGQFRHPWQEALVSEAMEYLYQNGAERADLQAVAEHLCVSERQLNRVFKTATGTTVINYFNAQRILRARYYLIATNYRLSEIAEQLGYYDQYHFSRNFKKATGYTPSQFRKIRRES